MIPAIEDIFHALSRGEMTFDDAEKYVRAHIDLASDRDSMRDVFAGLAMTALVQAFPQDGVGAIAKQAYVLAEAMLWERSKP